jgi:hypothetical protein
MVVLTMSLSDVPHNVKPGEKSRFAQITFTLAGDVRIGPSAFRVMVALQQWGWKTQECYPSDATIAKHSAMSRRSAQRALDELELLGLVKRVSDKSNPTGRRLILVWLTDSTFLPPLRQIDAPPQPQVRQSGYCVNLAHEVVIEATPLLRQKGASRPHAVAAVVAPIQKTAVALRKKTVVEFHEWLTPLVFRKTQEAMGCDDDNGYIHYEISQWVADWKSKMSTEDAEVARGLFNREFAAGMAGTLAPPLPKVRAM